MSIDERIAKRAKIIRVTHGLGHSDLLENYVLYLASRELLMEAETKSKLKSLNDETNETKCIKDESDHFVSNICQSISELLFANKEIFREEYCKNVRQKLQENGYQLDREIPQHEFEKLEQISQNIQTIIRRFKNS